MRATVYYRLMRLWRRVQGSWRPYELAGWGAALNRAGHLVAKRESKGPPILLPAHGALTYAQGALRAWCPRSFCPGALRVS